MMSETKKKKRQDNHEVLPFQPQAFNDLFNFKWNKTFVVENISFEDHQSPILCNYGKQYDFIGDMLDTWSLEEEYNQAEHFPF